MSPRAARGRQRSGGRRRRHRPRSPRGRPSRSIAIAFITGRPNCFRTAATRAGGSLPWSCSRSGLSASMIAASQSSSASTESATFCAGRARARQARGRHRNRDGAAMAERTRSRQDRRRSRAQRRARRRRQATDFDQQGHSGAVLPRHWRFVSPFQAIDFTEGFQRLRRRRRDLQPRRLAPRSTGGGDSAVVFCRSSTSSSAPQFARLRLRWRAARRHLLCRSQAAIPPRMTPR